MSSLYDELRKLAHARLQRLPPGQTLQTTDLVHEAYLRLEGDGQNAARGELRWNGRRHFFGAAAMAMRNILVDRIRYKQAGKRGGDPIRVELSLTMPGAGLDAGSPLDHHDVLALHEALERLHEAVPDNAEIVLLHCFAGLPLPEIANLTGTTLRTVERNWRAARAFLHLQMSSPADDVMADPMAGPTRRP